MPDGGVAMDTPHSPSPASPVRARPIATYLFILGLVALVPAIVFSAILLENNNRAQQRVVSSLTSATTQAIANAVDRQIDGLETTLNVLASDQLLRAGDFAAFHDRAAEALAGRHAYLLALDSNLHQLLNTRVEYGTDLGLTSDPASGEAAIRTGKTVISNTFVGRTAKTWVYNVVLPLPESYHPARVLILAQDSVNLVDALSSRTMPAGWNVALVDSTNTVITASHDSGLAPGSRFPIAYASAPQDQGQWRPGTLATSRMIAVYWNVSDRGWRVIAWAPQDTVEKPFLQAFGSLVFGGLLLAALVILVIYWVSLNIGRSVRGLEADAKRLGSGQPVEARSFPIAEIETVSEALGEASRRRQAAESEVRFLMRELAHRSKNQMTVIAAMAKQTARGAESVPEFVSSFEKRILGLAHSTDLLMAHGVAGVDLRQLIVGQIEPFSPVDGERVVVEGASLRLNAQAAQILGMAAHELATNAVKYGALARDRGTLSVTWKTEGDGVAFVWRERGSTLGTGVHRRGFGTSVLENMVGRSLGGEVTRFVHDDGVEWRFTIPLDSLDPTGSLNPRGDRGDRAAEI
jgi:two-component sensor histidine kinase